MLFNTLEFVIFLPIIILLYYLIPQKYRWGMLLLASYFFYMSWKVEYLFLILISTLIDFNCGILMEKLKNKKAKITLLFLSLTTNLGILFFFKYFNFASENLNKLFDKFEIHQNIPLMEVLLPVGISFYTFQTLSYTIDVFLGKQKAEKHLGYFALYVSFFPQLVAGPIERYSSLAPQLKENHKFNYENIANGLRLILYGLFIKMVIADNLAVYVDLIYASPEKYSSLDILKGLFFYSFQIYSDFYGYSIIAIGSAQLMGIKLMDNFRTPYLAKNISEFWQRWHISLSTWFRDYLYYPLGGNRVKKLRWILNILIVFIVSGLWHGANWTFLFWGGIFGVIYILENYTNKFLKINKDHRSFSFSHIALAIKTFIIVTFIWVFFRSQNFGDAIGIFKLLTTNLNVSESQLLIPNYLLVFLSVFILSDFLLFNNRFDKWVKKIPFIGRWSIYSILIFGILVFPGVENFPFIYFQF